MPKTSIDHIRLYRDKTGEYRWTALAHNGEPVADSGESYTRRNDAYRALRAIFQDQPRIVDDTLQYTPTPEAQ